MKFYYSSIYYIKKTKKYKQPNNTNYSKKVNYNKPNFAKCLVLSFINEIKKCVYQYVRNIEHNIVCICIQ